MDCDFCGHPVAPGDVYVRVFGHRGHRGEAHLRCPWWARIGIAPRKVIGEWTRAAKAGHWQGTEPHSFAEYRDDELLNLGEAIGRGEIDAGLEDLLLALNSHPRVCTSYSCRGHGGNDGSIQMHTDDGALSRRLKRSLAKYRDEGACEWDQTYSEPGHWFITVSVPADEGAFKAFCARLLSELGLS
ncbi:MAG: hypothetical protein ABFE07_06590 [Armatimonadia bacterium]